MKIIHIADIHWRGLSRHEEYILCFNDFFKKAEALSPDIIYVGGDIVHSKTQGISPELIQCLSWWFNKLAKICPVHVILGNHDGLILNKDRQDAITPIIEAINNPKIYLYKNSGIYPTGFKGINWCVFSCFDEEGWSNIELQESDINIGLYHGAIRGSLTDTDWQLDGEADLDSFNKCDFVLLGDIHKRQFLNEKKTVAYSGSTIQQNYGEDPDKGFLFWEIRDKEDFDVKYYPVKNPFPFVTVDWRGSVESTIDKCKDYGRQCKFRIRSDNFISQSDAKRLKKMLKKSLNATEVVFKIDSRFDAEQFVDKDNQENSLNFRDVKTQKDLLRNYYKTQNLTLDEWQTLDQMIEKYLSEISNKDKRHIRWAINKIKFDNLFAYGENNFINFENMSGITGIFGRNARGKSSIIGSIVYALFNTTDRGSISNLHVINSRRNHCTAQIDISINSIPYRIIRQTVKKQTKNNIWAPTTLKFYRLNRSGEVIEDLTEEQRRETEKIVREMIGTSDEFLMTSLASQGSMNTFIKEKASSRKAILTNFLDLDVFEKLYDLAKKDSQILRSKANNLSIENWSKKIQKSEDKIDEFIKKQVALESEIELKDHELDKLKRFIHKNDSEDHVSLADLCKIESEIERLQEELANENIQKTVIISNSSDASEKINIINEFLSNFDAESVIRKRDSKNRIEKDLLEIKNLYALEKKELDIIETSVFKLSEVPCGDSFPTCKFIKASHKNKQRLETQKRKVILLNVKIDDIKEAFSEFKNEDYDGQLEKYSKILKRKSILTSQLTQSTVEIERFDQKINTLRQSIENILSEKHNIEEKLKLQSADDKLSQIKVKVYELNKNLKKLDNDRIDVINRLAKWTASKNLFVKQQKEYELANKRLKLYDMFTQACSKRGIPVQIIHSLLPKINSEISRILQGVVGFTVDLEADLESNSMDIYINYGDSKRIIELGSGMEKMMSSLAIRVALINISTLPKSNMLIIDEGFGALDVTNLEACSKLLQSFTKWFKNILIISHIDSIKDIVDYTVDITKKGVDSYVYQP
jgi:DNA repair exonuclease SbcCD ATPase subunit